LLILCGRLLLSRAGLAAGRGLISALVLLRGRLLLWALAAGRGLLAGALVLLRRSLLGRTSLAAGRGLVSALVLLARVPAPPPPFSCAPPDDPTGTTATILRLRSTITISSRTTKYWCPRHAGLISISAGGTSTMRTLVGTTVPTPSAKFTLSTRGTFLLAKTAHSTTRCVR
jgi:hypothetical protein